jgi:HTH-type transcriptional regulator / antitoxin HigA
MRKSASAALEKYELNKPALAVITSDRQNDQYIAALLELEKQPHLSAEDRKYANMLAVLIESYEMQQYPIPAASPSEVLAQLIDANNLRQKDLAPIFGSESIVSEILNGKRELNRQQIEKLSRRFAVSPAVFFPMATKTASR